MSFSFAEFSLTKVAPDQRAEDSWLVERRVTGRRPAPLAPNGRPLGECGQLSPLAFSSAMSISLEPRENSVLEKAAVDSFPWGRRQRGFPGSRREAPERYPWRR